MPSLGACAHSRAASIEGIAEVIAVLDRRLTRSQADAYVQSLLGIPVAALEALLHRHRAFTAADAEENATSSPSPVFLTSRPP